MRAKNSRMATRTYCMAQNKLVQVITRLWSSYVYRTWVKWNDICEDDTSTPAGCGVQHSTLVQMQLQAVPSAGRKQAKTALKCFSMFRVWMRVSYTEHEGTEICRQQ